MEIKKFYKESNMIEDQSGDYVEVTMSRDNWNFLKMCARYNRFNDEMLNARRKALIKAIDKTENTTKGIWY